MPLRAPGRRRRHTARVSLRRSPRARAHMPCAEQRYGLTAGEQRRVASARVALALAGHGDALDRLAVPGKVGQDLPGLRVPQAHARVGRGRQQPRVALRKAPSHAARLLGIKQARRKLGRPPPRMLRLPGPQLRLNGKRSPCLRPEQLVHHVAVRLPVGDGRAAKGVGLQRLGQAAERGGVQHADKARLCRHRQALRALRCCGRAGGRRGNTMLFLHKGRNKSREQSRADV